MLEVEIAVILVEVEEEVIMLKVVLLYQMGIIGLQEVAVDMVFMLMDMDQMLQPMGFA